MIYLKKTEEEQRIFIPINEQPQYVYKGEDGVEPFGDGCPL